MDEWRPIVPPDETIPMTDESRGALQVRVQQVRELLRWMGAGRIFTAVVTVPLIGIGGYLLLRTPPPPVETEIEYATTVPEGAERIPDSSSVPDQVVVHVAGHVYTPGVYALDTGQRIVDAIRAAGGAQPIADLNTINLALLVRDGDQIYVPAVGEVNLAPAAGRIGISSEGDQDMFPVNINTGSTSDLEALPGVGPSTAAAIIGHRDKFGPFVSPSDLLEVPGIGPAKFEAIKDLVTV
jgi:competence protein ComEA